MQVSVESTGTLERRMEVQVPAVEIDKAVDERLQRLSRTVRLKGFRPGKVPVKVVRQQFGQQVRQEVLGDVMQSSFAEAVEQEKLTPAAGPRIEPINVGEGDLKYHHRGQQNFGSVIFNLVQTELWLRILGRRSAIASTGLQELPQTIR
jgi:trigger factor